MGKANARNRLLKLEALAKRGGDGKEPVNDALTEGEKVQVGVMLERLNTLQAQLDQVRRATADLISSIVVARGLDPQKFGVNLAVGRILPVDKHPPQQVAEEIGHDKAD